MARELLSSADADWAFDPETVRIDDAVPDAPGTAVAFTTPTIRRIIFENDEASGNVTVQELNSTSDEGPPLPGALRVVPASARDAPCQTRRRERRYGDDPSNVYSKLPVLSVCPPTAIAV